MKNETAIRAIETALAGEAAHRHPAKLLRGLTPEAAGAKPLGAPKCIHEILGHLVFWQDITLRWLEGVKPEAPADPEDAFPEKGSPADAQALEALAQRFTGGLEEALAVARTRELEAPLAGPRT